MTRMISRALVAVSLASVVVAGCSTAPSPGVQPRPVPVVEAPPRFVPKKDREVVSTTPEKPPLWYADYDAWRAKEGARRHKTFIIATGEGISESEARRNAFRSAVSSRSITLSERSRLNIAGTSYVTAYDDGSFKVTAIYEYAKPPQRAKPVVAARPCQEGIEYLCDELLEKLTEEKLRELGTFGVARFGYKTTPFPCEFSDFLEAELRRCLQRRFGASPEVLDPALMKPGSPLVTPDAAISGNYWPGKDKRTVRIQARITNMSNGSLLGTAGVNLSLGDMNVRITPEKVEAAETNLAAVNRVRQNVQQNTEGGKNFKIKLWLDRGKGAWKKGEKLVFRFRSERDCYLNLMHFDCTGAVQLLFPNQWHQDCFIRGGRVYSIPGGEMNFTFDVSDPFGTDIVLAVATAVRTRGLYAFRQGRDVGFRSIEGGTRGITVSGIGAPTSSIAELRADQKADAFLTFTTMP